MGIVVCFTCRKRREEDQYCACRPKPQHEVTLDCGCVIDNTTNSRFFCPACLEIRLRQDLIRPRELSNSMPGAWKRFLQGTESSE